MTFLGGSTISLSSGGSTLLDAESRGSLSPFAIPFDLCGDGDLEDGSGGEGRRKVESFEVVCAEEER